ncbi:MAG: carbamoyltransferase [bacterium]|nr:carbamoyltransferase [bacterium]
MNILGISAFYHDSAAVIIRDGQLLAAAQEERFTRKKHDSSFPSNAIKFCLHYSGLSLDELNAIVFYDKPLLKFERLLETYYNFAPKGIGSFLQSIPVWTKEKMFLKRIIFEELLKIEKYNKKKIKLLFPEHHLSHSASAFYPSPYKEAAILTVDGVGEWATASIGIGKDNKIEILKELRFPHSLGLLYSAFTYYLGFVVNSGEYKLMGLAPYGNPDSKDLEKYIKTIKEKLIDIKEDGSIRLDQKYFSYATGLRMVNDKVWKRLFGFGRRLPEAKIEQHHCDLALAIQKVTDEIVILMAKEAKKLTGAKHLCMAGGVALNCVANGNLLRTKIFNDIFIQPAAGDAGGALGAALAAYYIYFDKKRELPGKLDGMQGAYLGPEFSQLDIELVSKRYKAVYRKFENFDKLAKEVADLIDKGNAIGWFQGRMEFGPRALGNRSILGDARNSQMQKKLNLKIKYREGFRPFAPSVLAEECKKFFELNVHSPYMLLVANVKKEHRKKLPSGYNAFPLMKRLYILRSDVPAITHIDFSARIQTVHKETNERYWKLIKKFKEKTGYGIIVNTSFNVRGEPIVCSPEDAYKCFMRTEMDYLVMGDYLYKKTEQSDWQEDKGWKEKFKPD